jgi:hypothetical protein
MLIGDQNRSILYKKSNHSGQGGHPEIALVTRMIDGGVRILDIIASGIL